MNALPLLLAIGLAAAGTVEVRIDADVPCFDARHLEQTLKARLGETQGRLSVERAGAALVITLQRPGAPVLVRRLTLRPGECGELEQTVALIAVSWWKSAVPLPAAPQRIAPPPATAVSPLADARAAPGPVSALRAPPLSEPVPPTATTKQLRTRGLQVAPAVEGAPAATELAAETPTPAADVIAPADAPAPLASSAPAVTTPAADVIAPADAPAPLTSSAPAVTTPAADIMARIGGAPTGALPAEEAPPSPAAPGRRAREAAAAAPAPSPGPGRWTAAVSLRGQGTYDGDAVGGAAVALDAGRRDGLGGGLDLGIESSRGAALRSGSINAWLSFASLLARYRLGFARAGVLFGVGARLFIISAQASGFPTSTSAVLLSPAALATVELQWRIAGGFIVTGSLQGFARLQKELLTIRGLGGSEPIQPVGGTFGLGAGWIF